MCCLLAGETRSSAGMSLPCSPVLRVLTQTCRSLATVPCFQKEENVSCFLSYLPTLLGTQTLFL